ncbi:MAG: hypothetical protein IH845_05655, partial [Nanoarchaeota archaeon]|nr:hypothetical protein [Nanoarchaeota archaeon]
GCNWLHSVVQIKKSLVPFIETVEEKFAQIEEIKERMLKIEEEKLEEKSLEVTNG